VTQTVAITTTNMNSPSIDCAFSPAGWDADKAQPKGMFHAGREMSEITSYMEEYFKHQQHTESAKDPAAKAPK
jgi:hypothetical protein